MNPKSLPQLLAAAAAGLVLAGAPGWAQRAPALPPDATALAKYDKNNNGVLDADELATKQADDDRALRPAPTTSAAAAEEPVVLSPFEVISDTRGYYAANTVSGTRFNTKVEDLASSLTVVTKEQMADFAMLDVNDIFLYTAGTEGSGTYTDFNIDRNGSVTDNVQLNPTQANRVRGIGAANVSLGNFETMGRVPVDPLGIDSVEVSRGPNANVFGLGNPGGTVNMVPAAANLNRDKAQVTLRGDSYDGFRGTLDINRVLLKGRLAARLGTVFQHEGFVRKPSGVNTLRYNGMVKYQPFKWTTVSASYSIYRMNGNRPNFSPPRDSISYWEASGRPGWDPVTMTIHVGGRTIGPLTSDSNVPDYFNRTFLGSTRSFLYIDQGGIANWTLPNVSVSTVPLLSASLGLNSSGNMRLMSASPAAGSSAGLITAQPLFTTTPTVSDKAMYDWSSINLASVNRVLDDTRTSTVQLDQVLLNTPRHMVAAQFGWMREDAERYSRNLLGIGNDNGQSGQLLIDVNERQLDGSPNPFYLRPYLGQDQPRTVRQPSLWDSYRGQVAYRLDLSHEKNPLHWLGWHQVTGYDEYKYRISRRFSYRDAMASDHAWLPPGISRGVSTAVSGGAPGAPNITRPYLRFYVGDAVGNNVDYAPPDFSYGTYPFVWGGQNGIFNREPVLLNQVAVTDSTGGSSNTKTIIKTLGTVVQSHFLDDAIVTTFGVREDKQYVKNGQTPQILNPDGMTFDYAYLNHWAGGDYKFNSGRTKTSGAVVRPFRNLAWFNRQAREGSGAGRVLAGALQGLSLTYNKSDSFRPTDPKIDIFLRSVPNPSGQGTDYGFWLNLFDGRVVLRFNRWENKSKDNQSTDISTISQRVTRMDVASGAAFLLHTQVNNWVTQLNPTWTPQQVETEVARQMGMSTELQNSLLQAFNAGTLAATADVTAKGTEVELNLNPSRYWTIAASGTDTQSMNTNVSTAANEWIAQRMPIWTTIVDPRTNTPWWTTNYGGSQTAAQNYAVFLETPYLKLQQQQGKARPEIRRYAARVSSSVQLAAFSSHRFVKPFSVGGALRWEDKAAIGYYGVQQLPAVITQLSSRPIYDSAHTYIDAFVSYRTRLLSERVPMTVRLNVRNLQEGGRLQPIGADPDGTPNTYRIVDPRQFILQATFDL
jgi:hypothetical protein